MVTTLTASAPGTVGDGHPLIEVRLTAIRYAARDTHLYEFQRTDGHPLPSADAGSHVDIHLPNGMMRQYSLVEGGVTPESYVLGIKRDPASRGGSKYVFDELKVGRVLTISPPRNNFPLALDAPHTVLVAGGIGITPIWAMLQTLQQHGRSWELHFSCRSRADMAFLKSLQKLEPVRFHFDDEAAGKFLDMNAIVAKAPKDAHFYCCGPIPMLNAFEEATKVLPTEQVHVEYFTAKEAPNLEGGYVVELSRSGKQFTVPPGKSILEVLRDAGLNVPYSCEEGICGACETTVISGIPDHRDSVLTDNERNANKTMMICCSGCKSEKLVLDI